MAKRILIAIAFVLFAPYAEAAQCHALPDLTAGKWAWQWVESRICWYQGDEQTPKQSLHWDAPVKAAAETKAVKPRERTAATETAAAPGEKIQCSAAPEGVVRWTWRTIDAKRCWHRGPRDTPRALLYWPAQQRPAAHKPVEDKPIEGKAAEEGTQRTELPAPDTMQVAALADAEAEHDEAAANSPPQQADEADDLEPWQLVNPASSGDVEFLAIGERVPVPFMIDHNVGTQYLTRTPMAFWPLPGRAPAN